MTLTGELFVAGGRAATSTLFRATDPATGAVIEPGFSEAGIDDVERACAAADAAFPAFAATSATDRATLIEAIAAAIVDIGEPLIARASAETGLPVARLTGERARTAGQLRLFAEDLRQGDWMGLRIDPAQPEREPLPRPDLRLRKIPLGPVAVFGASNFPLAFSVAGGDTASALAAGCPVVVKGHPAHPGTSELVGGAIARAVRETGMPAGTFSLLNGVSHALGAALVADPRIKAIGFTGSRAGGLALMAIAAARAEPIPVYAEMSAVNPVILMAHALEERAEALAADYVGSVTLGSGQFCTNPGLVFAIEGPALDRFVAAAAGAIGRIPAGVMLSAAISDAYRAGVDRLTANPRVATVGQGLPSEGPTRGAAALFAIDADDLDREPDLAEEVFGASSVLVRCRDAAALERVITRMEGQLTATIHFTDADLADVARLVPLLEHKAGRLIANGWPTGVEVAHAMVHGGPFPATSDGRGTSVGTLAIDRFLRPVCYQDFPDALLPAALRDGAQAGVPHRRDGRVVAGEPR